MLTQHAGYVAAQLITTVTGFVREHDLGYTFVHAVYQMPEHTYANMRPVLSYVANDKKHLMTEEVFSFMPDLAVELFWNNKQAHIPVELAYYYLDNGSKLVWLIHTHKQLIETLTNDDRQILTTDNALTGDDLLPGFEVAINTLFPEDHD